MWDTNALKCIKNTHAFLSLLNARKNILKKRDMVEKTDSMELNSKESK